MKYIVHRRGIYYHATVSVCTSASVFDGLHLITPFWDPFRTLPSVAIETYSAWTVRAYRLRIKNGKKSWAIIKADFLRFLDWAIASELQHALEISFHSRRFHINCNWGATKRQPGGQGRYDGREDDLERMAQSLAER